MPTPRTPVLGRALLALAVAVAGLTGLSLPAQAAAGLPSAPRGLSALEGVDGIRLSWQAPEDADGLTAYQLQRVATPPTEEPGSSFAPFANLTLLPAATTTYFDIPTGGYYWSYRVLAVGPGGSTPSEALSTRLGKVPPAGSTNNQVSVDGAVGTRAAGGVFIDQAFGGSVTAARIDDRTFRIQAVPAEGAADQRAFSFVIGSTAWGHRLDRLSYPTIPAPSSDPNVPTFRIEGTPECGDRPGQLQVSLAEFLADGTPLSFSAEYTYCDRIKGSLQYNSTNRIADAMTADRSALSFSDPTPQTVTFANPGTAQRVHQSPAIVDTAGYPSTAYQVTADTCAGSPLAAGATCTVTVSPTTPTAAEARLVWPDGTALGRREVDLSTGPAPPAPTVVRVEPTLRGVDVSWNRFDSDSEVTGYTIYRGFSANTLSPLATAPGGGPGGRYVDRTVNVGTVYFYAVSATNAVGEGTRSAPGSAVATTTGTLTSTQRWSGSTDSDIALLSDAGIPERLTTGDDNTDPTIGPDGKTYVYSSDREAADGDRSIWAAVIGGAPRRLTDQAGVSDSEPMLSPDGTRIAFTRRTGGTSSVWLVPLAGGPATQIPGTLGDTHPTWAPSGRVLAAAHRDTGRSSIIETNLNGSVRRTLTPVDPNVDFLAPSWGPDARYLSLILRDSTRSMIAVADTSTSGYYPNLASPYGIRVTSQRWGPTGVVFEGRSARYSSSYSLRGPSLWKRQGDQGAVPVTGADGGSYASPAPVGLSPARTQYPPAGPPQVPGGSPIGDGFIELRFSLYNNASVPDCYTCPSWVIIRRSEAGGKAPSTVDDGIPVYEGRVAPVRVTGLTNLRQYAFSLFAVSTVGDVSAPESYLASPAPTPAINPAASVLTALSGDGPNFKVGWGKALPAEGYDYEVQVGTRYDAKTKKFTAEPTFKKFYQGPATSKVITAKPGTTYYLRTRVATWTSQVTAWSPVVALAVPYDDSALKAAGTWKALTRQKGRYLTSVRESSTAGSTLTLTASGSAFGLIADRCPTCGKVKVFVDGKLRATIDTYAKKATSRTQVWFLDLGTPAKHKIVLQVVGKGAKRLVRIDGLMVRQ